MKHNHHDLRPFQVWFWHDKERLFTSFLIIHPINTIILSIQTDSRTPYFCNMDSFSHPIFWGTTASSWRKCPWFFLPELSMANDRLNTNRLWVILVPLQSSCGWCTSWWARRRPQNHGWRTEQAAEQILGCWRSWGCSHWGFCRQLWGGSHDGSCSSDSGRKCWCHSDTLHTLLLRHNTGGHLRGQTQERCSTEILYYRVKLNSCRFSCDIIP